MALTDFKFTKVIDLGGGGVVAHWRIYEGEMQDVDGKQVYVRTTKLREGHTNFVPGTPREAMEGRLKAEIAKDRTREPITVQR